MWTCIEVLENAINNVFHYVLHKCGSTVTTAQYKIASYKNKRWAVVIAQHVNLSGSKTKDLTYSTKIQIKKRKELTQLASDLHMHMRTHTHTHSHMQACKHKQTIDKHDKTNII